jgi:hypothetical protein
VFCSWNIWGIVPRNAAHQPQLPAY